MTPNASNVQKKSSRDSKRGFRLSFNLGMFPLEQSSLSKAMYCLKPSPELYCIFYACGSNDKDTGPSRTCAPWFPVIQRSRSQFVSSDNQLSIWITVTRELRHRTGGPASVIGPLAHNILQPLQQDIVAFLTQPFSRRFRVAVHSKSSLLAHPLSLLDHVVDISQIL